MLKKKIIQKKDEIMVLPTDTIYGICTSAFSKDTVEKIYTLKGRDKDKPFIILISKIADLKRFGITVTKEQKKILQKIWPHKVSIIFPCREKRYQYLHRGTRTLAFRLPRKESLLEILKHTGPLVAPSANIQGNPPAKNISEAKNYFGARVDLYIAGPSIQKNIPSTLLELKSDGSYRLLREGSVTLKMLGLLE